MSTSAPRRSSRLKRPAETLTEKDEVASLSQEENDDEPLYKPRPAKRHKAGATQPGKPVATRGKGKLRNLPQMPLDILFDIFGFLTPLDVLRLARTTKDFRSLIMTRSAISLWKTVFANVPDVPACPEGISEPAYANFLFTNNCYQCLSPRATHSLAGHCLRYCKRCVATKVVFNPTSNQNIRQTLHEWQVAPHNSGIAFFYRINYKPRRFHYAWLLSDFDEFKGFVDLFGDQQVRAEFLRNRAERFKVMEERETQYARWVDMKQRERFAELDDARGERFKAIRQRLAETGWGEELARMNSDEAFALRNHPTVRQSRPLTSRTWKKIEEEILELMEGIREDQLARRQKEVIKARRQVFADAVKKFAADQPLDAILPTATDLYLLDSVNPVKQLIEDSPPDAEFSLADLDDFVNDLPQLCEEWKALCTTTLIQIANRANLAGGGPALNEDMLHLGKTVFRCSSCSVAISYPQILSHGCLFSDPLYSLRSSDPARHQVTVDLKGSSWMITAPDKIRYLQLVIDDIAAVLGTCGIDPETTTRAELDAEENLWLVWQQGNLRRVMGWRRAIQVVFYNLLRVTREAGSWSRLTDESLIQVYNLEEMNFYENRDWGIKAICVHCHDRMMPSFLADHMKKHNPDEPLRRSDFLFPDCSHDHLFCFTIVDELAEPDP